MKKKSPKNSHYNSCRIFSWFFPPSPIAQLMILAFKALFEEIFNFIPLDYRTRERELPFDLSFESTPLWMGFHRILINSDLILLRGALSHTMWMNWQKAQVDWLTNNISIQKTHLSWTSNAVLDLIIFPLYFYWIRRVSFSSISLLFPINNKRVLVWQTLSLKLFFSSFFFNFCLMSCCWVDFVCMCSVKQQEVNFFLFFKWVCSRCHCNVSFNLLLNFLNLWLHALLLYRRELSCHVDLGKSYRVICLVSIIQPR